MKPRRKAACSLYCSYELAVTKRPSIALAPKVKRFIPSLVLLSRHRHQHSMFNTLSSQAGARHHKRVVVASQSVTREDGIRPDRGLGETQPRPVASRCFWLGLASRSDRPSTWRCARFQSGRSRQRRCLYCKGACLHFATSRARRSP